LETLGPSSGGERKQSNARSLALLGTDAGRGVGHAVREDESSRGDMCAPGAVEGTTSVTGTLSALGVEEEGDGERREGVRRGEEEVRVRRRTSEAPTISNTSTEMLAREVDRVFGEGFRYASGCGRRVRVEGLMAERARREVNTPWVVPSTSVKMECELVRVMDLSWSEERSTAVMPPTTACSLRR
jgi:hypothetical protein